MNLSAQNELNRRIRETVNRKSSRVVQNLGEGTAILKPAKGQCVIHTEAMVEGIHFDLTYTTPSELGHRILAAGLASIAARGVKPLSASVSLGLRYEQGEIFVGEFFGGAARLAQSHKIDLVAENTFPSPSFLVVHLVILAESGSQKNLVSKTGAREGHSVFLVGTPGASAAGLTAPGGHGAQLASELLFE